MRSSINQSINLEINPLSRVSLKSFRLIFLVITTCLISAFIRPNIAVAKSDSPPETIRDRQFSTRAKAVSVQVAIPKPPEWNYFSRKYPVEATDNIPRYVAGALIAKDGDVYSALVGSELNHESQWLTTSDGQGHKITVVISYPNYSIVRFRSAQNYRLAKLGNASAIRREAKIYVTSAITGKDRNPYGNFQIYSHQVVANRQGKFFYDNNRNPQISNTGLIFNSNQQLIGFQTISKWSILKEDPWPTYQDNPTPSITSLEYLYDSPFPAQDGICGMGWRSFHVGIVTANHEKRRRYHQGITVSQFDHFAKQLKLEQSNSPKSTSLNIEDYLVSAIDSADNHDFSTAITAIDRAINLEPQNSSLYTIRGEIQGFSDGLASASNHSEKAGLIRDSSANFDRAIRLNPNENLAAFMRVSNQHYQGKLAHYDQLIKSNHYGSSAYYLRGNFKKDQRDLVGALADYNQMVELDPRSAKAYLTRGLFKENNLQDIQGALKDYQTLVSLVSSPATQYFLAKFQENKVKDFTGALIAYDRMVKLDANSEYSYTTRANFKTEKMQDYSGALADYNRAIAISGFSRTYYQRGVLKATKLQDRSGALADFQTVAKKCAQENEEELCKQAKAQLQKSSY